MLVVAGLAIRQCVVVAHKTAPIQPVGAAPTGPVDRYQIEASVIDGSVPQAAKWIQANIPDIETIEFRSWKTSVMNDYLFTTVDFSHGGEREVWGFTFDRRAGELQRVMDKATGKMLYQVK